ncbi:MAG: HAD hydrolase-like protein, partial [Fervidobacterium sp.]
MRKTGVIIFDMDDTLVNREEVYVKAQKILLHTLKEFGAKTISLNEAFTTLREIDYNLVSLHEGEFMYNYKELARALWLYYVEGKSVTDACSMAFEEGKKKIRFKPAEEAAKRHNKVLKETIPTLKENTFDILKKLKQKYVLVLLSVGKKNIQERVVSYYKFDKIFDLILIRSRKSIR